MSMSTGRGSWLALAAALVVSPLASGCGGPSMHGLFPEAPGLESRCQVGASQTSVLVTEWAAAEKANLEGMLGGGAVAVVFTGCQMRVLPQCRLAGSYYWQRTTPSSDRIDIRGEADLYAKLPLGAVSLSGELSRSGSLEVLTTVSGQVRLQGMTGADVPNQPECSEATHVVSALTLGAFVLSAGDELKASAAADVRIAGQAGGSYARTGKVVRSAGNAGACVSATGEAPSADCSSPIQVFLSPIPGRAPPPGPPGSVRVDFLSASDSVRWDVYVDDQATCTTPCSRWVDPSRPLLLRTREDAPDKLLVGRLDPGAGPLQVSARPLARGQLATGIVFTALGGLDLITGIALTAIGCSSDDHPTMCSAGLINMATGSVVTTGAVWLVLTSRARFGVRPVFGGPPGEHSYGMSMVYEGF
jgi:hypothetical protein